MTSQIRKRTRRKTELKHYITTHNITQDRLCADYQHNTSWEDVGRIYGVSAGLAYKIAVQGYEPKSPELRRKLGFPIFTKVELITSTPCQDGTQILEVRECIHCEQHRPFVPNVPSRRRCYACSPKR